MPAKFCRAHFRFLAGYRIKPSRPNQAVNSTHMARNITMRFLRSLVVPDSIVIGAPFGCMP